MTSASAIKLVVGLGNPGKKYQQTRHNVGRMVFDYLSFANQLNYQNKFKAELSEQQKILFLFPTTYMNLSGESVIAASTFYKIQTSEILVLHDELDLPYGVLAFKKGGGTAGHNGLKSMVQHLPDANFYRIRIGIGRPKIQPVSDYVLSPFSEDEKITLPDYLMGVAKALEMAISDGPEKAAALFSKKTLVSSVS